MSNTHNLLSESTILQYNSLPTPSTLSSHRFPCVGSDSAPINVYYSPLLDPQTTNRPNFICIEASLHDSHTTLRIIHPRSMSEIDIMGPMTSRYSFETEVAEPGLGKRFMVGSSFV
jgi:hypothetical protein